MITAEQKIGEKVIANGSPTKFPSPADSLNMVLADMRGYLDGISDAYDYFQMAFGAEAFPTPDAWLIHYWKGEPIKGLFEEENPLQAAPLVRERIHFLGFVHERDYLVGEIQQMALWYANPHLIRSQAEADRAFRGFPIRRFWNQAS